MEQGHQDNEHEYVVQGSPETEIHIDRPWRQSSKPDRLCHNQSTLRNGIKASLAFPEAEANLDHNLVIIQFEFHLKRAQKPIHIGKYDLPFLNSPEVRENFKAVVLNMLEEKEDGEFYWHNMSATIKEAVEHGHQGRC